MLALIPDLLACAVPLQLFHIHVGSVGSTHVVLPTIVLIQQQHLSQFGKLDGVFAAIKDNLQDLISKVPEMSKLKSAKAKWGTFDLHKDFCFLFKFQPTETKYSVLAVNSSAPRAAAATAQTEDEDAPAYQGGRFRSFYVAKHSLWIRLFPAGTELEKLAGS